MKIIDKHKWKQGNSGMPSHSSLTSLFYPDNFYNRSEPKVKKVENPKFKEEEEALRKRFTEQVKMEEARFRQWGKLIDE